MVSFLFVTDEADLVFCVSFVSTLMLLYGLALLGLCTYFSEGKVYVFFLDFPYELGGLLEFEFDLVLRLSDGVWYLVLSFAPPMAELNTAYNWCSDPNVDSTKSLPALNSEIALEYCRNFS